MYQSTSTRNCELFLQLAVIVSVTVCAAVGIGFIFYAAPKSVNYAQCHGGFATCPGGIVYSCPAGAQAIPCPTPSSSAGAAVSSSAIIHSSSSAGGASGGTGTGGG